MEIFLTVARQELALNEILVHFITDMLLKLYSS